MIKNKTFPVFINYDKQNDISDTTKYEDHFTSHNRLIAISKSGRSIESEDVQNFLNAKERGIDVQLFVRKTRMIKYQKNSIIWANVCHGRSKRIYNAEYG